MLKTRIITALVALPAFILIIRYLPTWCVMLLFLGSVLMATYEISHLLIPTIVKACAQFGHDKTQVKMTRICMVIAPCIFLSSVFGGFQAGRGMIVFGVLGSMLIAAFSGENVYVSVGAMMGAVVSICYGALPWLAIWDLYIWEQGPRYILFACAIVWGGDTGAYFAGRKWGKTPLSKKSPKKTREGAIGGLVASVACAIIYDFLYSQPIASLSVIFLAGLFGGIFGQLGDLLESSFKRFAHIKDSGNIFPGHGGFLDRVDSVLFAAPVIWFILFVAKFGFKAI